MQLYPFGGMVLIKPVDLQRKNSSGLVLSSTPDKVDPSAGVVIAAGTDVDPQRAALLGETVSFVVGASAYEKAELVDGVKHILVPQENIVGVFK
ncbi:putative 10 kDa chaperonin [Vibrio phage 207E48.1]|nr:putative 10 kDa chaperonin [Vibrio phage 207E48.1]